MVRCLWMVRHLLLLTVFAAAAFAQAHTPSRRDDTSERLARIEKQLDQLDQMSAALGRVENQLKALPRINSDLSRMNTKADLMIWGVAVMGAAIIGMLITLVVRKYPYPLG
jgi:transposase